MKKFPPALCSTETTGAQYLKLGLEQAAPRHDVRLTVGPSSTRSSPWNQTTRTAALEVRPQAAKTADWEQGASVCLSPRLGFLFPGRTLKSPGELQNHPNVQAVCRNNLTMTFGDDTQVLVFVKALQLVPCAARIENPCPGEQWMRKIQDFEATPSFYRKCRDLRLWIERIYI